MKSRDSVFFYLNGEPNTVTGDDVFLSLADYLRERRNLKGTKIVCAEGDCGACTVLKDFEPINSCIATTGLMDGSNVVTVDAIAKNETLSLIQDAMVKSNGSQCGFCTPGFVMALSGLAERKCCKNETSLSTQDVKNALTGNLCRCTGYQPIIEAGANIDLAKYETLRSRFKTPSIKVKSPIHIITKKREWYSPLTLSQASAYLKKNPGTRILSGGTDIGVQINKGKTHPEKILDLHLISELHNISIKKNRVKIGAKVSLSTLRRELESQFKTLPSFLDIFASPQIKNMASIVGNLANASPIGDTLPFLLVAETKVFVSSSRGKRTIPIEKLWTGYRTLSLKKSEWITHIEFSIPGKKDFIQLYKASQRKDLDISAVNAAFWVSTDQGRAATPRLAFGGVGATPIRAVKTEALLKGQQLTELGTKELLKSLQSDISPQSDLRGSHTFRRVVAHQFMLDCLEKLGRFA